MIRHQVTLFYPAGELAFLANYDETTRAIQEIVDMSDRKIDLRSPFDPNRFHMRSRLQGSDPRTVTIALLTVRLDNSTLTDEFVTEVPALNSAGLAALIAALLVIGTLSAVRRQRGQPSLSHSNNDLL